jgi:hypothetical protein
MFLISAILNTLKFQQIAELNVNNKIVYPEPN